MVARGLRALGVMPRRLEPADMLIQSEFGFVPFDRLVGTLLFNVLAQRHRRHSVLLSMNLAFSDWPKVFGGNEQQTAA